MKKLTARLWVLCLLALLQSLFTGCKKEETEVEETPSTTDSAIETTPAPSAPVPPANLEEYPEFPWPPPRASAQAEIPRQFLVNPTGAVTLLSDVNRRLTAALERNGYFESSYYAVPKGFALVTKMEQISADGAAQREPDRWITGRQPLEKFSLGAYLRALFSAAPGRYRIIVFIVTPFPFSQSRVVVSSDEAADWLAEGLDRLPGPIGQKGFTTENYRCTALVYEFERTSDVESPKLQRPSPLLGRAHLEKAGIWAALAK